MIIFGPNVFTAGGKEVKDSALSCELTELCSGQHQVLSVEGNLSAG